VKVGAPVTDITAGILAALGVVSALFERERTGKGQHVDTSLFEAGITQTFWQSAIALASGVSPGPMGSAHPLAAPYQTFPTTDGWINVGASNEATWARLTEALNAAELREDPRFSTNADRMAHLDDLVRVLAPHFLDRSTESWLERLQDAGVPAGPIASVGEMLENPQTKARGMVIDVEHSSLGLVRSLGFPVKMSGSGPTEDAEPPRGAPLLGEHTRQVLAEAGFTGMEVDRLIGAEIVR
jgi:crotonobetainyl-CoA:carnitine CoA-transferase CaiB-like acyl-CoA transferase